MRKIFTVCNLQLPKQTKFLFIHLILLFLRNLNTLMRKMRKEGKAADSTSPGTWQAQQRQSVTPLSSPRLKRSMLINIEKEKKKSSKIDVKALAHQRHHC